MKVAPGAACEVQYFASFYDRYSRLFTNLLSRKLVIWKRDKVMTVFRKAQYSVYFVAWNTCQRLARLRNDG